MTFEQGELSKESSESLPNKYSFQLPDVKNFIYGDFESKYERTVFKKTPGAPPVAIFYTQSGKELERVNLEKFDRYVHSMSLSLSISLSVCVCAYIIFTIYHFSMQGGAQQDDGIQGNPAQSQARRSVM